MTKEQLIGLFQTGDIPTGDNFASLIVSILTLEEADARYARASAMGDYLLISAANSTFIKSESVEQIIKNFEEAELIIKHGLGRYPVTRVMTRETGGWKELPPTSYTVLHTDKEQLSIKITDSVIYTDCIAVLL